MEENEKITISKFEYDELNRIKYKYELILMIIFNSTYLNYYGELDYDCSEIDKMLKLVEQTYYKSRLKQLNENNKENKEG